MGTMDAFKKLLPSATQSLLPSTTADVDDAGDGECELTVTPWLTPWPAGPA